MSLIDRGQVMTDYLENLGRKDSYKAKYEALVKAVDEAPAVEPIITGETSDGYHTFNELYHHRAVLFSVIVKAFPGRVWKSRQHHDGSMYDGMFIVGIDTPDGPATYHYDLEPYWDIFRCKEIERAPEWDGHTAAQAVERIGKLEPVRRGKWTVLGRFFDNTIAAECTCCGEEYTYKVGKYEHIKCSYAKYNYCPNCGAKMNDEKAEA